MKLLNTEELASLKFKERVGKPKSKHPVIVALLNMRNNDSIFVSHDEWDKKSPPMTSLYGVKYKKFKGRSLIDNSGWVITRIN